MGDYQLKTTSDGSHTLYVPHIKEQYHSLNGAVTESMHVFIERGYNYSSTPFPVILEIGFGTGLNCLLTALQAEKLKRATTYYSIDNNILPPEITGQLNYGRILPDKAKSLFPVIHEISWGDRIQISEYFELQKIYSDIAQPDWQLTGNFDIVYFDAFGPDKQPEMWTGEIFRKIYERTVPKGVFLTYSAKGEVRRRLAKVGYTMERLAGPPGKKEMLRGIKKEIN